MTTLIIATRNRHKTQEIQTILSDRFHYLTLNDFAGVPPVVEDADTFAGNATKKATAISQWLSASPRPLAQLRERQAAGDGELFVLADDSGLEVDALDGAPGVHSARFSAMETAGTGDSPDAANNAKLLRLLEGVPADRRIARFRCVLALAEASPNSALRTPHLFEGVCEGRIGFAPKGQGGFGYDPLFIPDGYAQSFAELGEDVKNRLSHRARALEKLKEWLLRQAS